MRVLVCAALAAGLLSACGQSKPAPSARTLKVVAYTPPPAPPAPQSAGKLETLPAPGATTVTIEASSEPSTLLSEEEIGRRVRALIGPPPPLPARPTRTAAPRTVAPQPPAQARASEAVAPPAIAQNDARSAAILEPTRPRQEFRPSLRACQDAEDDGDALADTPVCGQRFAEEEARVRALDRLEAEVQRRVQRESFADLCLRAWRNGEEDVAFSPECRSVLGR